MLAYVISVLSNWLYTYILVALLLAAGLYFTLRTRFVQPRMFGESFRVLREEKHEEGGVSSFQALMISTASRVGTGNIAGVSIAICLGGVGARRPSLRARWRRSIRCRTETAAAGAARPTILKRCWGAGGWPCCSPCF